MSLTDSGTQTWFVRVGGKIRGPFLLQNLLAMKDQGRIHPSTTVSTDRRTWLRASSIPQLFENPSQDESQRETSLSSTENVNQSVEECDVPPTEETILPPPLPSDVTCFYCVDGVRHGPMCFSALQRDTAEGKVRPNDLVWTESGRAWTKATEISTLSFPTSQHDRWSLFHSKPLIIFLLAMGMILVLLVPAWFLLTPDGPKSAISEKEPKATIPELEKKAQQGSAKSQTELGKLYYRGQVVDRDMFLARNWFEKAAKQNYAEAHYYLAFMYFRAEGGFQKSQEKFLVHLRTAAAQGYTKAKEELDSQKREEDAIAARDLSAFVGLTDSDYAYNESHYDTGDTEYLEWKKPLFGEPRLERRVNRGIRLDVINGVNIRGVVNNTLHFRTVTVRVEIRAQGKRVVNSTILGSVTVGGKEITDSFQMDVPPGGRSFSKYYDLRTKANSKGVGGELGKLVGGAMTGDGLYGSELEAAPTITVSIVK